MMKLFINKQELAYYTWFINVTYCLEKYTPNITLSTVKFPLREVKSSQQENHGNIGGDYNLTMVWSSV